MKRKNYILFLAAGVMAAALSLNSCDNRMGADVSDEFTFSATAVSYTGSVGTKAAPINTVSAFESTYTSFKVSAYNGATAKFTDKTSSYSGGEWSLNTNAKWYPNETLDFYALAFPETYPPLITLVGDMVVNPSTKTAIFDYTFSPMHSAIGENTPDIMFGYYTGEGVLNTAGNKRVAPLTFYHPFSAIRFVAGDIAGAKVNSITIKNVANGGTCTIAASNLATAGNSAISWTTDVGHIDYGNTYNETAVEDQQIGTDAQILMLIPQTLGENVKLVVSLTVTDEGVDSDVTLEASLKDVVLEAGKILTFKINYADIPITIIEPEGMIVPYDPVVAAHINDPILVPKFAYLPSGSVFNTDLTALAAGRPITKITFDRFGGVDETTPDTVEIQEAANGNHPEGEIIYAHYDNGEITISTHANTIYLNSDCSAMFKDMAQLTQIQWGNFFESEYLTEVREMFMGCSSLLRINLTGVLNTSNVTDMSHMFDGCSSVTSITLGLEFYTSNVTNMSFMFKDCESAIELPAPSGANVTDYSYYYYNCARIITVNGVNTSSATNMDYMYYGCIKVSQWWTGGMRPPVNNGTAENMFYGASTNITGKAKIDILQETYNWVIDPSNNTGIDISLFDPRII